jgi:hypothetical protein
MAQYTSRLCKGYFPRWRVMECCIRWPALHNPPTTTQLRWFGMSWTAEWRKSNQQVLSICGNSFKTVGKAFQVGAWPPCPQWMLRPWHAHTFILTLHTQTHTHTLTYNHNLRCCYSVYHIFWCQVTLPLHISTSITPVSLHIVNIGLELTLYIGSFFLVFLVCFCSVICYFCATFTLITALLDLQLARKAFHCAFDIKTGTHTKDQSQRGKIISLNHCTQCICPTCFMTTNGVQAAWRTPFLSVVILPVTL